MKSKKTKRPAIIKNIEIPADPITTNWTNTNLDETYMDVYKEQAILHERLEKAQQEAVFWKAKAQHYGEKFGQALKGFLLYEGKTEIFAEFEKQKVLRDVELS